MNKKVLDNPQVTDNRNYDYSGFEEIERPEYDIISGFVAQNSSVVDLGCGNGTLLQKLQREKNCTGKGIELSPSAVEVCLKKHLDVLNSRIDTPSTFEANSFDYAICNVTIQMVMYPEVLLTEMKRIAKKQIISFPNFAYYKNRIDILLNGVMPRPQLFGYSWYNTGHIHQLSLIDFQHLLEKVGGLKVVSQYFVSTDSGWKNFLMKLFPNLFQPITIFLLEKIDE